MNRILQRKGSIQDTLAPRIDSKFVHKKHLEKMLGEEKDVAENVEEIGDAEDDEDEDEEYWESMGALVDRSKDSISVAKARKRMHEAKEGQTTAKGASIKTARVGFTGVNHTVTVPRKSEEQHDDDDEDDVPVGNFGHLVQRSKDSISVAKARMQLKQQMAQQEQAGSPGATEPEARAEDKKNDDMRRGSLVTQIGRKLLQSFSMRRTSKD